MMKITQKLNVLLMMFTLMVYNTCFADVVSSPADIKYHGMYRRVDDAPINKISMYVFIAISIVVVVACILTIIILKIKKSNSDKK